MKTLLLSLALVAVLPLISNCNYKEDKIDVSNEPQQGPTPTGAPTPPEPPKEWFTALKKTVFKPKCESCHNPGNAKDDVILTSYAAIMDADPPLIVKGKPKSSRLYQCLVAGAKKPMPKEAPSLTPAEIQAVFNWIQKGAPENDPGADSPDEENEDS